MSIDARPKRASGMRPSNQFEALGMAIETVQEVEARDVSMEDSEKKRDVETWRDELIPDSILQKYEGTVWGGLGRYAWPETRGVVYKQLVQNFWDPYEASTRDAMEASVEIFRHGEWLDEGLRNVTRLEHEKQDLEGEVEEMRKVLLLGGYLDYPNIIEG